MSLIGDDPALCRTVLENLPIGVYVLDRESRFRFWNRGAERITGYLAHEVVGQSFGAHVLVPCDQQGRVLPQDRWQPAAAIQDHLGDATPAFFLHKQGHRLAVEMWSLPLVGDGETSSGVAVVFQDVSAAARSEPVESLMANCLDPIARVPSHRLTRAVLSECTKVLAETHSSFGLLQIRVLGLEEFSAKHGRDSVAAFLRTTAQTLRHSLDPGSFLGCWGEDGFVAVLDSASPAHVATVAESISKLLGQSEIVWWGDHHLVQADVSYTMAHAGDSVAALLKGSQRCRTAKVGSENSAVGPENWQG